MPSNYRSRYRSLDDVSMRHRGTWIGISNPTSGVVNVMRVDSVEGNLSESIIFNGVDKDGNNISCRLSDPNVIITLPEICMVNHVCPNTGITVALWNELTASRQLRRSLNLDHVYSNPLGHDSLPRRIECDAPYSVRAYSFFNHTFPTFSEAYEAIISHSAYTIAFSSKFALGVLPDKGIVVYYRDKVVGYLDSQSNIVILEAFDHLTEQLQELTNVNVTNP